MARISIVVPVYHNARSLRDAWQRFCAVADQVPEEFEFIFVDDGSRDDSFAVMQELVREDDRVRAVRLVRNFGADAASSAGFSIARGDAVVAISADLQDPPELIRDMLAKWREGHRLVLAARAGREDGWLVRWTSGIFWWLFRKLAIPTMPPQGCDYVLVDRVVIDQLAHVRETGGGIGMLLWTGYEPAIIHYQRKKRDSRYGRSMWTWPKRVGYLIDLFVTFTDIPIRVASAVGVILAVLGGVYASLLVLDRLTNPDHQAPAGWTVLMVLLLVVSGVQLVLIGLLGEYVVRGLSVIRRRPYFLIDRVVEGKPSAREVADPGHSKDKAGQS